MKHIRSSVYGKTGEEWCAHCGSQFWRGEEDGCQGTE